MSVELMSNKELMSSKELRQQQAGKRQHNTNSRQVKQAKLAYTSRRNLMAEPHPPAVEDMQPWQLRKNISRSIVVTAVMMIVTVGTANALTTFGS